MNNFISAYLSEAAQIAKLVSVEEIEKVIDLLNLVR